MRRCPWRLGYGSTRPLQGALRGRASRSMFCLIRRGGPRYEPSSRLSACRMRSSNITPFRAALEEALEAFPEIAVE